MTKEIRLITYNIDGLPYEVDLNNLPWILKPLAWGYKLFKGTTKVVINDNTDRAEKISEISKLLNEYNADIIGVQEDFNYHKELIEHLPEYKDSTHTGRIDTNKLFSNLKRIILPKFKGDGLNLLTKKDRVSVIGEDIIPWKKSFGYTGHANDKLTSKGFRFYSLIVDNDIVIDVYLVHMDADFYNAKDNTDVKGDIKARKAQLDQLCEYINNRYNKGIYNPIIIFGDTNSTDKYTWDADNINSTILSIQGAEEAVCSTRDVDRLFYINNPMSAYRIECKAAEYGPKGLSDHMPFIVDLTIEK